MEMEGQAIHENHHNTTQKKKKKKKPQEYKITPKQLNILTSIYVIKFSFLLNIPAFFFFSGQPNRT